MSGDDLTPARVRWSLSAALVIAMALETAGALVWIGAAGERLDQAEAKLAEHAAVDARLAALDAQVAGMRAQLNRIEARLDDQ